MNRHANSGVFALLLDTLSAFALLCALWPISSVWAEQVELAGLSAQPPSTWMAQPPQTSMRLAQFQIESATGAAEAVVFYFGPHQGGTPEANIARWQSQFSTPQGGPVEPQVERYTANGMQITQALLEGNYARGIGTGPVGTARPDQALLAAIVEGPQGKLFVQLYGPSSTVKANIPEFESFVRSMSPR